MNTFRRKELNNIAKELTALREKLEVFMRTSMKHTTIYLKVCKTSKEDKQCLCDIEDDIRELVAIEENLNQIAERQSK